MKEKQYENDTTIIYKISFIDSIRFMLSSLSSLADNLAEGLHNSKSKNLEYIKSQDKLLILKCLDCNKKRKKCFNKICVKKFASTYEFCDGNKIKFCLMLRKGLYPC